MTSSSGLRWTCGDVALAPGARPLLMGILNVTPDSFADGGRHDDPDRAVTHGLRLAEEGAAIVDVGGESTRPGAAPVPVEEELRRVIPVVARLAGRTQAVISVDTSKAAVARAAIAAGARIINDVTALGGDPEMAAVARATGAGVILMHMRGTPRTMQAAPRYADVATEVRAYLAARLGELTAAGIRRACLAVDPGIGFGKTAEHNLQLLARLDEFTSLGAPVVVGLSRKSFLGAITGRPAPERLAGTLAALAVCVLRGAHVLRVHDVREARDALEVTLALQRAARRPTDRGE